MHFGLMFYFWPSKDHSNIMSKFNIFLRNKHNPGIGMLLFWHEKIR